MPSTSQEANRKGLMSFTWLLYLFEGYRTESSLCPSAPQRKGHRGGREEVSLLETGMSGGMRPSVCAVLLLSVVNIGIGAFFLFLMLVWGKTGGNEIMDVALLSPLFVGIAGIAFLRVKQESLESTNATVWIALAMYAALGAFLLWVLRQITSFGAT
jgi:hypothetical protein